MALGPKPKDPADRFWPKVDKAGPVPAHRPELGSCWIWTAAKNRRGQGQFGVGSQTDGTRRLEVAYRWAYEATVGPVPDGLELDHLCRTPSCVRPDHLEPVTHQENMRRGRYGAATHCPHGHPYDEANTYRNPNSGNRLCRACGREAALRYYRRKKAA